MNKMFHFHLGKMALWDEVVLQGKMALWDEVALQGKMASWDKVALQGIVGEPEMDPSSDKH